MNGWPRFLPVVLAALAALLLVSYSLYSTDTIFSDTRANVLTDTAPRPLLPTGEWSQLVTTLASSSNPSALQLFSAPRELSTTASLAQEIGMLEQRIAQGGMSNADIQRALQQIARTHVTQLEPNDAYTTRSLHAGRVPLETYAESLKQAMAEAGLVDEYELVTFAKTVRTENHGGTPSLVRTAALYRIVERKLLAMTVPDELVATHLGLLKSVAFMAQCVELMGGWTGDHTDALVYIDGFVRSDTQVGAALKALGDAMIKFGKTP